MGGVVAVNGESWMVNREWLNSSESVTVAY